MKNAIYGWNLGETSMRPWPLSPARLRRRLFAIAEEEVTVARRGFRCDASVAERIEEVGRTFLFGYHAAIEHDGPERLASRLAAVRRELSGFAYEGAAMSLALLDFLTPWKRSRLAAFLAGPGEPHVYLAFVGAGWAIARLPFTTLARLASLDPLLFWLAVDGCGFHAGYFHWPRVVERREVPAWLCWRTGLGGRRGCAREVFDQGLGRSLWFIEGARPERIAKTISRFPFSRRADLWSGVGLAASYTGWAEAATLLELRSAARSFVPELAQGAAFAAKARQRAGNPTRRTDVACRVFCGLGADQAAAVTDHELRGLPAGPSAYEIWRQRIQQRFSTPRGGS
jgi:hypothetical protein